MQEYIDYFFQKTTLFSKIEGSKTTKSEPNVYTEFPEAMPKAQAWATVPTPAPRNRKKDEEMQFKDLELHLEIQVGFS